MRYYKIAITDPDSGAIIQPPGFAGVLPGDASYTSYINGQTIGAAWDIELDIPVIDAATSQGFSLLRIWGVSLAEISQANDLGPNPATGRPGKNIAIYGGMQKGLPLANPAQSGLLVSGNIFQCFGNWIGTDQTLDFVIAPGQASSGKAGPGTVGTPRNFTLNWQGGQPLGPALKSALQVAFPGYTVNVNVSDMIVRPDGDTPSGFYSSLEQLAQATRAMSRSIIKTAGYAGIVITVNGTTVTASDGTGAADPTIQIAYQDLIGQPTWIESPNIQLKTVMRADLSVLRKIMLPPTLITNTAAANSGLVNQRANFQGGFSVVSLRHVGRYRTPRADGWVTVIEATPQTVQ